MTLFPTTSAKTKSRPSPSDRTMRCIPTGAPRLVESSTDRSARSFTEAWQLLLDTVRRSSMARLSLLSGRQSADRVVCPWARIMDCHVGCRCGGVGTVTVGFLRKHYDSLADDIERFVRPARARRRS